MVITVILGFMRYSFAGRLRGRYVGDRGDRDEGEHLWEEMATRSRHGVVRRFIGFSIEA
jgi:hypothetical protein